MQKFWELFEQSVITQSVLTVGVVGVYLYLVAAGKVVTQDYYTLMMVIVSFWFGSKAGYAQGARAARSRLFATREDGE